MSNGAEYTSWEMEVVERLTRIEANQKTVATWIVRHESEVAGAYIRLANVEQSVSRAKGALWLLGILWGTITIWVGKKLGL